jgi:hypothetical protein
MEEERTRIKKINIGGILHTRSGIISIDHDHLKSPKAKKVDIHRYEVEIPEFDVKNCRIKKRKRIKEDDFFDQELL